MKTEHVEAIVRFIRRVKPADLLLPAGAALISAGLQQLVDREDRQRKRLAALAELVDDHRQTLEANGVDLPPELFGDEAHPLDIEGALQIVLARTPSEPEPEPAPRPPRRGRALTAFGLLGLAGAAGITWAHSRGWLAAYTDIRGANHRVAEALDHPGSDRWTGGDRKDEDVPRPEFMPLPVDICHFEGCGKPIRWSRRFQLWSHLDEDGNVIVSEGEPHNGVPAPAINLSNEPADVDPPAPLEVCGWPGCDWTSEPGRSELSQATAAAVHRNRCTFRPAGAMVRD